MIQRLFRHIKVGWLLLVLTITGGGLGACSAGSRAVNYGPIHRIKVLGYDKHRHALSKKLQKYAQFAGGGASVAHWFEERLNALPENKYSHSYLCLHINENGMIDTLYSILGERDFDRSVISLMEEMPSWSPALDLDGNPTDCWYYQCITAKRNDKEDIEEDKNDKETDPDNWIFVEYSPYVTQPEFPGGEVSMYEWIAENMRYTPEMLEVLNSYKPKGRRVTLQFRISPQGDIVDAEVIRGVHPALDEEALRLVNSMPRWVPAVKYDNLDNLDKFDYVTYILPISFKVPEAGTTNDGTSQK